MLLKFKSNCKEIFLDACQTAKMRIACVGHLRVKLNVYFKQQSPLAFTPASFFRSALQFDKTDQLLA